MTHWSRTERMREAMFDELAAWGFFDKDPGPPARWRRTDLWQQQARFREAPHEEPGFLAAWLQAIEKRYPRLDDPALWNGRVGRDPVIETVRAFMEDAAWTLARLAKAGNVAEFHRMWLVLLSPEADAAP